MFLAARASTLHQYPTVRFDPNLSFHFYDLDFCRSAKKVGLSLGVWPIPLIHKSGGNTNSAGWRNATAFTKRNGVSLCAKPRHWLIL